MIPKLSEKPLVDNTASFNRAPPGHSLADSPGKWAWERAPEFSSPNQAVDALIDSLQKPDTEDHIIQLMASGVSVEEISNTTTKLGFMEGKFTADVAEIIRPNIGVYLMGLAVEAGIDNVVKVIATPDGLPRTSYGMSDMRLLSIMKDRNPDMHRTILTDMPEQKLRQEAFQQQLQQESFLGAPEPSPQEGMMVPPQEGMMVPPQEGMMVPPQEGMMVPPQEGPEIEQEVQV